MMQYIGCTIKLTLILWLGMLVDICNAGSASSPISTAVDPYYFGSHYFVLSSLQAYGTTSFTNVKPFDNYETTLNKVYTNIKQQNIILSSFKCQTNYNFGIKLDVQIVGNPTSKVSITIEQLNSTRFSKIGVSVIIVAEPFDKVMTILQFDMDQQNFNYSKSFIYPTSRDVKTYIKSMNIKSSPNAAYWQRFWLIFDINSISSNQVLASYNSWPNKSPSYDHKVQIIIIFIDLSQKNKILQLNFLNFNRYYTSNPTFPTAVVGIDTVKYGTDFNKKCILGLMEIRSFNQITPKFYYDLDPAIGLINTQQNSQYNYIGIQSFCFRDLQCPDTFTYRKLNDYLNCYNCSDVSTSKIITYLIGIDNIAFCTSYDASVQRVSYAKTGEITGYCKKCLNCEDHYYANLGTCVLCNNFFQHCKLCDQKTKCLQCFSTGLLNIFYNCTACSAYISDCLQCTSATTCTVCQDGFYLSNGQCVKCSLTIDGCIKCNTSTNCLQCNPPLIPRTIAPGQVTCECQTGKRVTATCSLVHGCISSHMVKDKVLCYACNSTANFMYIQGHDCICKKGYNFDNKTLTCNSTCGDGIYVETQACDDKNKDMGDGCDDKCKVQTNFICENVRHIPSVCRLNINLKATVYSLSRSYGSSSLTLKLKFDPYDKFMQHNSWANNIVVNSSKIEFTSHEFQDNILVLHYAISQTVEFDTLDWTLLYDSHNFLSSNQSLSILMKGQNAPLTLQKYYKQQLILYIVSYVLGGLSLLIAIVAMVKAESNIAFQLCTTVLFIFYSRVLIYQSNTAMLYTLGGLRTAAGWNDIALNQHTEYLQYVAKNRFYIKSQLSLTIIITMSILILLFIIKLSLQIKSVYHQLFSPKLSTQKQIEDNKNQDQQKSLISEYWNLLALDYQTMQKKFTTPIILISMFTVFAVFSARQMVGKKYETHFSPVISNLVMALFFLIILYYSGMIGCVLGSFYDSMQVEKPKRKKNINNELKFQTYFNWYSDSKYLYLIFLVMLMLFCIDFKKEIVVFQYMLEVCLGMVTVYMLIIIVMRPYTDKLSQFAIISHQIIKILFLVFLYLQKKSILDQFLQLIGVYAFLSLILFIEILSFVRIKKTWIPFKSLEQKRKQQKMKKNGINKNDQTNIEQEQAKKKKKKYKKDDQLNSYRYENIKKKYLEQQQKMKGFKKDDNKKPQNNKELSMLKAALQKGDLKGLLLGNTSREMDVNGNNNQSGVLFGDLLPNRKKLQESNFLDEEISRRQRAQQLRKIKQKMRKQTQMNNSDNIFSNSKETANFNGNKNNKNTVSPQKKWKALTHQQELQKKYQYDVWRQKNLQRAMEQQEQKLRRKTQNKRGYHLKRNQE